MFQMEFLFVLHMGLTEERIHENYSTNHFISPKDQMILSRLLSEDRLLWTKAYLPGKYTIYSPNLGGLPLSEIPSSYAVQAVLEGSQDSFYHATFFSHEIDVTSISLA